MRTAGSSFVAVSLLVALVAATHPARGAASARLLYMRGPGAETCPGESVLRASVAARLGYDPFFAWARDTLFASITRANGRFVAEIRLVDAENLQRGARDLSIDGDDCAVVIDAMGLTVSLTIDPSSLLGARAAATTAPLPPLPTVGQATQSAAARLEDEKPIDEPRAPPPGEAHLAPRVGIGTVGAYGAEPGPSGGGILFVGAAWRALSVDVEGRADVPSSGASEHGDFRVRSWLVTGSLVPCWHPAAFFACPVVSIGRVGATAVDVAQPRQDHAFWSAAGARLGFDLDVGSHFAFRIDGEALAALTRNSLSLDGSLAYTYRPVSIDLGLAALWRFR